MSNYRPTRKFKIVVDSEWLPDDYSQKVLTTINNPLFVQNIHSERSLAWIIYNYGIFEYVSVQNSDFFETRLTLTLRKPILCFFNDKLQYVDKEGTIFGSVPSKADCKNGTIVGMPVKPISDQTFGPQKTTVVDSVLVEEALSLMSELANNSIDINKDLIYHRTRGFIFQVKNPTVKVIMGRAPFALKATRLSKILSTNNYIDVEQIELDYRNKVFVKKTKKSEEISQ